MERKMCFECGKEVIGRAVRFLSINPWESFVVHDNDCRQKIYSKIDRKRILSAYKCRVDNGIVSGPVKY